MVLGSPSNQRIQIDVRLEHQDRDDELATLRTHLLRRPPEVPARYFYDDRGSTLFEQITATREYYQTRTEQAILRRIADDVIRRSGAVELVELGSGASVKTRVLLAAMESAQQLERYVPYDVNRSIVERVARELCTLHSNLRVHGIVGDFTSDDGPLPDASPRLVLFLGGTIGNFDPAHAIDFLSLIAHRMEPGDCLLLGTDRIKDPARLEAAYNDSEGLSAEFNRNILHVLNNEFDADFLPTAFDHRAIYNERDHRIEMHLVSNRDQLVSIGALEMQLGFASGQHILTEISVKYDRGLVAELLESSGLHAINWYTDDDDLFALSLAIKS